MWTAIKRRLRALLWTVSGSNALAAQISAFDSSLTQRLNELDLGMGVGPAGPERNGAARQVDAEHILSSRFDALESGLNRRLLAIEDKIDRLEEAGHGARSTYVGNNRVLVKVVVAGHTLAYLVEADDRLISPWFIVTGGYETDLTNFFVRELRPDSRCIDVGSNFGYFTCLMSRLCPNGRVLGIEADAHVYELARDNIHINGFSHFAGVIHAAASNSDADMVLHRRFTRSGNSSITKADVDFVRSVGEPLTEPFTVKGVRIDNLARRFGGKVDFMKIDVEGAEPLVLEGARATIAANPQLVIVMEWARDQIEDAGFSISDFLENLDGMGLQPFDILPDRIEPLTWSDLGRMGYRAGIVLKRRP